MIYLTGDTHGNFDRIEEFCEKSKTSKNDLMIILGDAGINFFGGRQDERCKELLDSLPLSFLCIHGNHERRPNTIISYREAEFCGGTVYVEDNYPSIYFAKDGEIYDLDGYKCMAIGGAYSIDKPIRLVRGHGWWADEQPSEEIKARVMKRLESVNFKLDAVFSHTIPRKYEPVETYLAGIDEATVDKSTEDWLDSIEDKLDYKKWYCGHYHIEKDIDKVSVLFKTYKELMK
ncbi:MAG: metallophosphoesterase [Lachnospiraceae bacterium]|nr:metallophosphoesterase [Lachnospiraceae bacterium]